MSFWDFGRKKKEVEQPKQVENIDLYKLKEKKVPRQESFLDTLKETDFGFCRIVNIRKYRGSGISCILMINPQYMFRNGELQGFSPTMNGYREGLLVLDGISSKISDIHVEINISDTSTRYDYRNGYERSEYTGYNDFYDTKTKGSLYYNRQAFANAIDEIVTQTKQSFLTDNKVQFKTRINCNISVNDQNELRYQVSKIVTEVKSIIEKDFIKEIKKSKLIEAKDKFFQDLSEDVLTDIFQHIIDIVPESKLAIGNESIKFHVPIIGKNTHKDLRVSFVLDDKVSNILYELGESSKRISGYCQNSQTMISFSQQGIIVSISPKLNNEIIVDQELPDISRDFMGRYTEARVRNPYTGWNLS